MYETVTERERLRFGKKCFLFCCVKKGRQVGAGKNLFLYYYYMNIYLSKQKQNTNFKVCFFPGIFCYGFLGLFSSNWKEDEDGYDASSVMIFSVYSPPEM